jgi:hypothetical protein
MTSRVWDELQPYEGDCAYTMTAPGTVTAHVNAHDNSSTGLITRLYNPVFNIVINPAL